MMLQARPTAAGLDRNPHTASSRARGRRTVPQARTRCWEGIVAPRGSNRGKLWRPRGLLIAVRDGVSQLCGFRGGSRLVNMGGLLVTGELLVMPLVMSWL